MKYLSFAGILLLVFSACNSSKNAIVFPDIEERMMDTDFADFKPLGLWVHGPGVIHTSRPIADVSDLNGLKLRAP